MISDPEATDTQIEANQGFERVWSRAQTGLQGLIAIAVVAGLAGLFGDGWFSTMTRAFPSVPLSVTYERLLRANAPADLSLAINGRLPGDTLELGVGSELLDRGSIGSTQPGAADVTTTAQGVTYTIRLGPDHSGHVMMKLSVRKPGAVDMVLTANGDRLVLPLFVYP